MSRRRDRDRSDRDPDPYGDLMRWIASYLAHEGGPDGDDGPAWRRDAERPRARWADRFAHRHQHAEWLDELHGHLDGLREHVHGVSANGGSRRSRGRRRWRRSAGEGYRHDAAPDGRRDEVRAAVSAAFVRLAVIAVTALLARQRARRRWRSGRGLGV